MDSTTHLVHRAGDCSNGPCPNVFDASTEPEMAIVQGTRITDPQILAQLPGMPAHEGLVLIPKRILIEYARKILAEEVTA